MPRILWLAAWLRRYPNAEMKPNTSKQNACLIYTTKGIFCDILYIFVKRLDLLKR